jgi:hypothetical protein
MECFLLYLDDLEDWIYAIALIGERIRRGLKRLGLLSIAVVAQIALIVLAVREPALGAAFSALIAVVALYLSATVPVRMSPHGT